MDNKNVLVFAGILLLFLGVSYFGTFSGKAYSSGVSSPCKLGSLNVDTGSCSIGGCKGGDSINLRIIVSSGDCSAAKNFHMDSKSDDGKCVVSASGSMVGVDAPLTLSSSTFNGIWVVPTVSASCSGETVYKVDGTLKVTDSSGNTIGSPSVGRSASRISFGLVSPVITVPSAPLNLVALAYPSSTVNTTNSTTKSGYIALNWNAPSSDGSSSITSYYIYRGTSSGGETYAYGGSFLNWDDFYPGGYSGTTFYYKVTAVNSVGESAASNEVSATVTS